jgi:hypothetical protein
MIESHVNNQVHEMAKSEAKATHQHKHKHHHKKGKKHHHKHAEKPVAGSFVQTEKKHTQAPAAQNLVKTKAKDEFEQYSMPVDIPIDEVKAITMKVSTTFGRDEIDSVTLKSFRKVIGYDTFESILNKYRNEAKDTDDHYNITVSMMVRRIPEPKAEPVPNAYNGGESLAAKLDKGFPYDDDGDVSESTVSFKKHPPSA